MQSNRRPSLLSQFGRLNPWLTVLEVYHVGRDVKATVVGSIDYGMLVELNSGIVALLRKGDIDWVSIEPMQALRIGEVVDVRIIGIDPDRQRMYVSRRVLLPNPIDAFVKTAQVGAVYLGTVRKCVLYGAFVEIAPGVQGLLHISEMAGEMKELTARSGCTLGVCIRVCIIGIDSVNRRISLAPVND